MCRRVATRLPVLKLRVWLCWDLNPGSPTLETDVLTTRPQMPLPLDQWGSDVALCVSLCDFGFNTGCCFNAVGKAHKIDNGRAGLGYVVKTRTCHPTPPPLPLHCVSCAVELGRIWMPIWITLHFAEQFPPEFWLFRNVGQKVGLFQWMDIEKSGQEMSGQMVLSWLCCGQMLWL